MKTSSPSYLTATFALVGLVWTGVAETSNPLLNPAELPASILDECHTREVCQVEQEYSIHWLDKTAPGNVFLVAPAKCERVDQCTAWLVEKTPAHVTVLLAMEGRYRLLKGRAGYPEVHVKKPLSDTRISYSQFKWHEDNYLKTVSKEIYTIDGVECGTIDECHKTALKEMQHAHPEQALKIWETVHRISWI